MAKLVVVIGVKETGSKPLIAAEALKKAAEAAGVSLSVETQTSPVDAATIAAADAVLLLGDVADETRFAGKTVRKLTLDAALADPAGAVSSAPSARKLIVGITSCPTGIAHTFMAAEGVEQGAKALGYDAKIETQGSVGAQNTLTAEEIAAADLVIIAADTNVDLSRFVGKRVYSTGTKGAISNGKALVEKALAEATVQGGAAAGGKRDLAAEVAAEKAARAAQRSGPYKHLMTGVSYMLPFVVAGGLLIALAFALGGIYVYDDAHAGTLGQALFNIGKQAFSLMVPILAGFIAYSIADRPGITPGAVGGMIAGTIGAGFLGGIVAGFLAGYVVLYLNRYIKLGRNLDGLKPVLILPLLGTTIVGLLMVYVLGEPVAAALNWLTDFLKGMQGANAIVLGAIIGMMMAFDMGGPVNKAAYTFATGLIASQLYEPMAAAMVAGMTPPLGLALATKLFRDRFSSDEHEAGNAAAVLGISFITEGAIPFAAKDPFRVIPSLMAGSAVAGMISMAVGSQLRVPHGGIFVLPIPNAVTNLGGYVVAMIVGTIVTALLLRLLKPKTA
ncbi:PTS fructose transporter subunit IIC [Pleomorphomonas sp. NRK KF1]|uniref:PTS fructose transporter subunit IIC n=1 Tax=Pleomorphomonas sp. NRK KF1 TaxID=2943000 RepID=UPI002042E425|nr:fructose-specific PTS transporter subunit EIIC [Pleomorphomonas sp. NRK KF1]MCM5552875.1 fructose-specific PTS transporter subunit EIIC [Pleomorphomonas sp. NRK KF1]